MGQALQAWHLTARGRPSWHSDGDCEGRGQREQPTRAGERPCPDALAAQEHGHGAP